MHKSFFEKKHGVVMWSACAQTPHNHMVRAGITTLLTHMRAHKHNEGVHNKASYARFITRSPYVVVPRLWLQNNRLTAQLIPTIHSPYIYLSTI